MINRYSCIKPVHGHGLKILAFITTLFIITQIITRFVAIMATLTFHATYPTTTQLGLVCRLHFLASFVLELGLVS